MKASERKSNILGAAPAYTIAVTQKEIEEGCVKNSNHCMVAEALKRAKPGLSCISVDIQTIRASDKKKRERYVWLTPRNAQQLIVDFDSGKKPKPFKMQLMAGQTVAMSSPSTGVKKRKAAKARLHRPRKTNSQSRPHIIGGSEPPRSVGQRREYGLRSLAR